MKRSLLGGICAFGVGCVLLCGLFFAQSLCADEGMWLFSNPPTEEIEARYGFRPTSEFLDRLRLGSIRFSNGGSASFVSSRGLVMTNHHIAFSSLGKLSTPEHDYVADGYFAQTLAEELKCPDLELLTLMSYEDVTARVNGAVTDGMTPDEAKTARQKEIAAIESESLKATGLFSEVMSFYQGGRYHLYRYKKFTDVRLVFAPEENVGYFGGEPDNFEYPRYNLDAAFFRIYENDKPYVPEHFFPWSERGASDGELVFVAGHPGRTDRLLTVAHLEFLRDVYYPYYLNRTRRQEVLLQLFSEKGADEARRASSDLFRLRNSRKNRTGVLLGLQTPSMIAEKRAAEEKLQTWAADQTLPDGENPWRAIAETLDAERELMIPYDLLETGSAFNSRVYALAKKMVRLAVESEKPESERLPEYRQTALSSLRGSLLSATPIDADLEMVKLTDSLGMYLEYLGDKEQTNAPPEGKDGYGFLDGRSPKERAAELLRGTRLFDPEERKKLLDGGLDAVKNSDDPMIRLAWAVDAAARPIRADYERRVAEPRKAAYTQLANLRFAAFGETIYPDATFTLRLSYGKVAGYTDTDGTIVPPWTTIAGAYAHAEEHDRAYPFSLSPKWFERRGAVDESTPMNLITTNDIIGGNSGSPMLNTRGEIVGLIFDGNIDSLPLSFIYSEETARAVAVHSAAIPELLRKIYRADRIADELGK